jgi:multimeric flavodoxin WrbA
MKIVAIQSSPNLDGLTSRLAQAALRGAAAMGAETELIHLNTLRVNPCKACGNGWGQCRNVPDCIQKGEDDFDVIRAKLVAADGIVFSTPVYFWDISESAKIFLDRLRRVEWPRREAAQLKGKAMIGIAAAGGSGTGSPSAIKSLENYMNFLQLKPVVYLPVSRQNKEMQLKAAEEAGRFMIEQLRNPQA